MIRPAVKGTMHPTAQEAGEWTCPNCRRSVMSAFCPDCGERRLHPHDLRLTGLLEQFVEAVTHADGRLLRTFRDLFRHPGVLTAAYAAGRRKPYLGPVQVFFIANVLFFLLQSAFHMKVFSTPLEKQMSDQFYSGLAAPMVKARLAAKHETVEDYTEVYNHAAATNAKSLIIAMAVPLALMAWILFFRRRPEFGTHAVFALHFYAFWMLLFFPLVAAAIVLTLVGALRGVPETTLDAGFSMAHLAACACFLYVAVGRVYDLRSIVWRIVAVIPLALLVALMLFGYRFIVLFVTLYTT